MISIAEALTWWSRTRPDQVAIDFEGDEITYRELDSWADGVAQCLAVEGIQPGDRVAIAARSSQEWCACALGAHRAGAVVVPFNTRMTARELAVLAEECEPRFVFADNDLRERMEIVQARLGFFELRGLDKIASLRGGEHADFPSVDVAADAASVIVFTSGTTGRPKGVVFTHMTLAAAMFEWSLVHEYPRNGLRPLMVLPMFTAAGVIWCFERTILVGGTLVLESHFDPARAVRLLQEKKITNLAGPSIVFDRIADAPGFVEADLSSLKNAHVGGSRVEGETIEKWRRRGVTVCQMYGQTEIGGFAMANTPELGADHPEFCGWGGVFTRARIVDGSGKQVPPGTPGEILLRGPGMTPRYWNNPAATDSTIIDGWIHSGDVGFVDDAGNLTFVDRMTAMIITGGLNVSPAEVEDVIEQIPGVVEVAVIPVPDPTFEETPAALVYGSGTLRPEDVVAYCIERLADYKVPRYVVLMDSPLPRTATGKLEKTKLRSTYQDIAHRYPKVR